MTKQEFIKIIAPLAVADMKKNGVLASITIAQACLETGYGGSSLMLKYNAPFGVKATDSWLKSGGKAYNANTDEFIKGSTVTINAAFRAYNSLADAVEDHANVLKLSYYNKSKGGKVPYDIIGQTDYKKAAECLLPYATGQNYIKSVINIIEINNFTQYDIQNQTSSNGIINHVISTKNEMITSPFGWRTLNGKQEHHDGLDMVDAQRLERTSNVNITAFADGKVVLYGLGASVGNYVDILHNGNILTRYFHMKQMYNGKVGQTVKKGDILGNLGTTGNSTGIHLHIAVKENSTYYTNGVYVDPMPYLKGDKRIPTVTPTVTTAVKTIAKNDTVKVNKGAKSYDGKSIASFVYDRTYKVDDLTGERALLDKSGLCTAFNIKDLTKV